MRIRKFIEHSIIVTLIGVEVFAYAGIDCIESDFENLYNLKSQKLMPTVFKNNELKYVDISGLDPNVTFTLTVEDAIIKGIIDFRVAKEYFVLDALIEGALRKTTSEPREEVKVPKVKKVLVADQTPTQAPSIDNGIAKPRK